MSELQSYCAGVGKVNEEVRRAAFAFYAPFLLLTLCLSLVRMWFGQGGRSSTLRYVRLLRTVACPLVDALLSAHRCSAGNSLTLALRRYPSARFYQYNVDKAEDIAQELGARQVPSFTVFKDGMVVDGVTGAKGDVLERLIKEEYEGEVVEGEG